MEAIDQVCTYDQAKRLCELGAPQDAWFTWADTATFDEDGEVDSTVAVLFQPLEGDEEYDLQAVMEVPESCYAHQKGNNELETGATFSAFTLAELDRMLPEDMVFRVHHTRTVSRRASFLIGLLETGKLTFPQQDAIH